MDEEKRRGLARRHSILIQMMYTADKAFLHFLLATS